MFKEDEIKRFNSSSLNPNSDSQITDNCLDMLPTDISSPSPTTTTTKLNHSKIPLLRIRKLTKMPSNTTIERCCFLLIHLLFYIIILTIVYIRLEQFTNKQDKMFITLRSNDNLTLHKELERRLLSYKHDTHSENNADCACQTLPYPTRNRTTRCLQLRVGLIDTIENVFCPLSNSNEYHQWLLIQNRETNSIDFNRTWIEYRRGFGNIINQTDFWIGNDNIYWLTNTYSCRLKIELVDWYNESRTAIYEKFRIANHQDGYRIQIGGYHGDVEISNKIDSFSRWHHNARFSTYDHYATTTNCPKLHGGGGWWYHSGADCAHVQLNGRFATHSDGLVPFNTGILWIGWKADRHYAFQRVHMAIQPKSRRARPSYRH